MNTITEEERVAKLLVLDKRFDLMVHVVDAKTTAQIEKNTIFYNKKAGINIDKKANVSKINKNTFKKRLEHLLMQRHYLMSWEFQSF